MRTSSILISTAFLLTTGTAFAEEGSYYAAVNLGLNNSTFTQGGFNTPGNFENAGSYYSNTETIGLTFGKENAFTIYSNPVRLEFEASYIGPQSFTGGSFPGYPNSTFFYDTEVETLLTLANVWVDYKASDASKWTYSLGVGVGASTAWMHTDDGVVSAEAVQTSLAYMFGGQFSYDVTSNMSVALTARHIELGDINSDLYFSNTPGGEYNLKHSTNEVAISVRYYFR